MCEFFQQSMCTFYQSLEKFLKYYNKILLKPTRLQHLLYLNAVWVLWL